MEKFTKTVTISIDRDDARKYISKHVNEFVDYMAENASYDFWNFFQDQDEELGAWIKKGGLKE